MIVDRSLCPTKLSRMFHRANNALNFNEKQGPESGQDLIEYTLLMAFVALASAALFLATANTSKDLWTKSVTVTVNGPGTIAIPSGKLCAASCSFDVPNGREAIVEAYPDGGAELIGWSDNVGCENRTSTCVIRPDADMKVKVTFRRKP